MELREFGVHSLGKLRRFVARAVFTDRCVLSIDLSNDRRIDDDSIIKLMDPQGRIFQLAWSSQVKELIIPNIWDYLPRFLSHIELSNRSADSVSEVCMSKEAALDEITKIRSLVAIQTRKVPSASTY